MEQGTGWCGEERRGLQGITMQIMSEVRKMMEHHEQVEDRKFNELKEDIDDHRAESMRRHEDLVRRFDEMSKSSLNLLQANNTTTREIHAMFVKAFPEGDAEAHRRAHERWIAKAVKEEEFWLDVKKKAVGAVVTAIVLWVGVVLWAALVKGPIG